MPDPARVPSPAEQLELVGRVLDLLPDFFYVHDYDLRFFYANQKAATYFGKQDKSQLVGLTLEDVDPNPGQARQFVELCQKIMDAGEPRLTDNIPYRRPDGSLGYLRQHDIPFINPKTGNRMLIGLSRDITIERDLEAQRLRAASLQRELDIAQQIQLGLRPDAAAIPKNFPLDLAAHAQPAAYAGGDFYDWFLRPDGQLVVFLGDVTGHGVGPALLASECRAYARVLLRERDLCSGVRELDQLLALDLDAGRFITFAAMVLDPATFTGEIYAAGQGPILLSTRAGVTTLPVARTPLGIALPSESHDPDDQATPIALAPGDAILLPSDGLLEAHNPRGDQLGLPRVAEILHAHHASTSHARVDALTAVLREHSRDAPQSDDVTIVCVGRMV